MEGSQAPDRYVVSFLDILGYSKIVSKQDPEKTRELYTAVKEAVKNAEESCRTLREKALKNYGDEKSIIANTLGFRVYSDNITVYCGLHPESDDGFCNVENAVAIGSVLMIQARVQTMLLSEHHLLSNGGTAIGPFSVDDNFLFGKALVDAYVLGNTAGTPRMLVTREVKETLLESARKAGYTFTEADHDTLFPRDFDGELYVRYLVAKTRIEKLLSQDGAMPPSEPILRGHYGGVCAAIEANKEDIHKDRNIRRKYVWVADYNNREVGESRPDMLIDMRELYDMELPAPGH